jgi:hypothetical protein
MAAPLFHSETRFNEMPFAARIRELSEQLTTCRDDALSLKLAQELHELIHEQIEQMRERTTTLPVLSRQESKQK